MMTSVGTNRARGSWEQTQTQSQTQHKQRPQVRAASLATKLGAGGALAREPGCPMVLLHRACFQPIGPCWLVTNNPEPPAVCLCVLVVVRRP